jgi:hypothetical protein
MSGKSRGCVGDEEKEERGYRHGDQGRVDRTAEAGIGLALAAAAARGRAGEGLAWEHHPAGAPALLAGDQGGRRCGGGRLVRNLSVPAGAGVSAAAFTFFREREQGRG